MIVCVHILCIGMLTERPEEAVRASGARETGDYELLHVGAWIRLGSSGRVARALNCWVISPAPKDSL